MTECSYLTATQVSEFTPLDRLIQVDLEAHIGSSLESGCLIPLPAQTGIGKTHTIKQKILEELAQPGADPVNARTIYYITNSVDNVRQTHKELLDLIASQELHGKPRFSVNERASLKSQVVYLPSQSHQLLEAPDALVERVINRFDLNSDSQIRRSWSSVKKQRQSLVAQPGFQIGFQDTLDEKAAETYRLMINRIQARQRSDHPAVLSQQDQDDLEQLVPGERLQRKVARVCFMTTRKFLAGYQTVKARIHPVRELSGALVFIDEFDRQNEIILQFMADQKAMDLIELTRTLHANLQQHKLELSHRYHGIEEIFDTLRTALSDFKEQWNLQYSFNIDGASLENEKVRLFSDRTVTHAHSSQHILRLATDEEIQKNIIRSDKKAIPGPLDDNKQSRFSRFINEADWLFQRFIWVMRSSVWLYLDNVAKTDHQSGRFQSPTLQDAVMSILRHLNLQDLSSAVFRAFDAQASFTGRRSKDSAFKSRMATRTYHDNGLKLTDVRRNEGTLDTVSCYYTGFTVTPSGLLARLVESGAKIIGISATATSPTVIKNFDLEYLKTRLGSGFVELTQSQKASIDGYYQSRRRYSESGVQVEAHFLAPDQNFLTAALDNYSNRPVRKPAMLLNQWLDQEDNSEFPLIWVSELLKALDQFMAADTNRYMLVFLNRTLSTARHQDFITFLEFFLQARSKITQRRFKLFPGMDAKAMRLGGFDRVLKHLSETNDKVIVLSTYASMGEGKNPDYPVELVEDKEGLIWVGDGPAPAEVKADIDTLYLEKPTHQLLSDADDYQVNQLLLLHQIMALQEKGWIPLREGRQWIKQALQGTHHNNHLGRYYETEDYAWLIRKVIEQAVGRSARTAFKRKSIKIFCDSDLQETLATDTRPSQGLSHEYVALVTNAAEARDFPVESREAMRLRNRAALFTADTLRLIQELMSGFHGAAQDAAIQDWEDLRKQLLTEPTREAPSATNPRLYLQSPSLGGYRFSGNLEVGQDHLNSDKNLHFFDQAQGSRWVSEAESGLAQLMKNRVVKNHFETHGYATSWQHLAYIMNPAAFFNLYKGALGEAGIAAILQHYGFAIDALPAEIYEVCDYLLQTESSNKAIGIDAKHWRLDGVVENHNHKMARLKRHCGVEHFAYINLFGTEASECRFLNHDLSVVGRADSTVIEVPGLIHRESGELLIQTFTTLQEWLGERE